MKSSSSLTQTRNKKRKKEMKMKKDKNEEKNAILRTHRWTIGLVYPGPWPPHCEVCIELTSLRTVCMLARYALPFS